MLKVIIISLVVIVALVILGGIIEMVAERKEKERRAREAARKRAMRAAPPPTRIAPQVQKQPTPPPTKVAPPVQRQQAARQAARDMNVHQMHQRTGDAVQIKQVVHQKQIRVDTSVLDDAQRKIQRICSHAEKIRMDVECNWNNAQYLMDLYRTGVGVSNEAFTLRKEIGELKDNLYRVSRENSALKPVFQQVKAFYQSVMEDEIELNNRNAILRKYIGSNFGTRERAWNAAIEERIRSRRMGA